MIPPSAWCVYLQDHVAQAGAAGYHDDRGNPRSYVAIADDLANGSSWTVTASHETLEMLVDPGCMKTVVVGDTEYAHEVADCCEDDQFAYRVQGSEGRTHLLTAFALRAWFDPKGKPPYTFPSVAQVTAPFGLATGGYIGARALPGGQWTMRLAQGLPGLRTNKSPNSRTMRRFGPPALRSPPTALHCKKCLTSRTGDVLGATCRTEGCNGVIEEQPAFSSLVDVLPEPMRCPRRDENPQADHVFPGPDHWQKFKAIDNRVCSYCGSLHPDDMFRLVKESAEAPADAVYGTVVEVEPSDKSYKTYVRQPGVRNAHEGGIKFYMQHVPRGDDGKLAVTREQQDEYGAAVRASRRRFRRTVATGDA